MKPNMRRAYPLTFALLAMAARKPQTEEELATISGVGPKKRALYGEAFLRVLRRL